jgi:hypothetical protein
MEQELARRLRAMKKEQLILLLEELIKRNATLSDDIASLLNTSVTNLQADDAPSLNADELVIHRTPNQIITPQDIAIYRQRIESYDERLQQGEAQQAIFDELVHFLQGADELLNQDHYLLALEIYETILDTRLSQPEGALAAIFDRAVDEFLPELDLLLAEASSLMIINPVQLDVADTLQAQHPKEAPYTEEELKNSEIAEIAPSETAADTLKIVKTSDPTEDTEIHRLQAQAQSSIFTPQLSITRRQSWLARLFGFWLKRMDRDDHHLDEQILEMIHETMWSEDIPMIRQLILDAIAGSPSSDHANIVDFSHQSRVRHLEKLLREFSPGTL